MEQEFITYTPNHIYKAVDWAWWKTEKYWSKCRMDLFIGTEVLGSHWAEVTNKTHMVWCSPHPTNAYFLF